MAKITSKWHEVKTLTSGAKLIEGDFILEDGTEIKATIWRLDKNNTVFPNFDTLAPGHQFEAEAWKHPTKGTYTLYPPRNSTTGQTGGNKGAMASKMMDKKAENIAVAQERREDAIYKSACQRDAVLITTTFYKDQMMTDTEIAEKIEHWRKYLSTKLETPF